MSWLFKAKYSKSKRFYASLLTLERDIERERERERERHTHTDIEK